MEILLINLFYIFLFIYIFRKKKKSIVCSDFPSFNIIKSYLITLKSLYISSRYVEANNNLKLIVDYINQLNNSGYLSPKENKEIKEEILSIKSSLISLSNYRGKQAEIIEKFLNNESTRIK